MRIPRTIIAALAAIALPLMSLPAANAATSSPGLYGSADPTYDGVFRQSLAILGLDAVGAPQSPSAVAWLLNAQCADGSFQEFRTDPSKPCDPVDLQNFTGPDTNATGAAIAALHAIGTPGAVAAAKRAVAWLNAVRNADGGWPMFPGAASDANSTGIALSALRSAKVSEASLTGGKRFLATLVAPCTSSDGGAISYQKGAKPDSSATAQGYLGLVAALPVSGPRALTGTPACGGPGAQRVGHRLAAQLARNGALASSMGGGTDDTSTAIAVFSLVSAGVGRAGVAKATAGLARRAPTFTAKDGSAVPAAIGLLLLVAEATGKNPRSFGGVDLVAALQGSEQR